MYIVYKWQNRRRHIGYFYNLFSRRQLDPNIFSQEKVSKYYFDVFVYNENSLNGNTSPEIVLKSIFCFYLSSYISRVSYILTVVLYFLCVFVPICCSAIYAFRFKL